MLYNNYIQCFSVFYHKPLEENFQRSDFLYKIELYMRSLMSIIHDYLWLFMRCMWSQQFLWWSNTWLARSNVITFSSLIFRCRLSWHLNVATSPFIYERTTSMMGGLLFFLLCFSTELFPINLYNFDNDTVCHAQPVGEWPPFGLYSWNTNFGQFIGCDSA